MTRANAETKATKLSFKEGRYGAKLLFQWRVVVDGKSSKRRACEERIILVNALNGQLALREVKRRGRAGQCRYKINEGNPVFFEFVGVIELLRLDNVSERDEVWYDITERVCPKERKQRLLPPEKRLSAIRYNE